MSVYFTSDLHLGHRYAATARGFSTIQEHDDKVIRSLSPLTKRDKLFIVGDVAFTREGLARLAELTCVIDICLGNHDNGKASTYLEYANQLWGCTMYKGWLVSHYPAHPQEIIGRYHKGNIHGHIHKDAETLPLGDERYFNVNWDFHWGPVSFADIDK